MLRVLAGGGECGINVSGLRTLGAASLKGWALCNMDVPPCRPALRDGRRGSLRKAGSSPKLIHPRGKPVGVWKHTVIPLNKGGEGVVGCSICSLGVEPGKVDYYKISNENANENANNIVTSIVFWNNMWLPKDKI